jgi:hypothetical protein
LCDTFGLSGFSFAEERTHVLRAVFTFGSIRENANCSPTRASDSGGSIPK